MPNAFKRSTNLAGWLIAAVLAVPAAAQPGNPGFTSPGPGQQVPGVPAPDEVNASDRIFVQMAALGGMSEVELGRLAQQRGTSKEIQAFASQLVDDHEKANGALVKLAQAAGVPVPDALDPRHRARQDRLEQAKGDAFDRAWLAEQLAAHQMTAQLLAWEIGSGQNAGLKDFASANLPVVLGHLQKVQALEGQLRGAARPLSR